MAAKSKKKQHRNRLHKMRRENNLAFAMTVSLSVVLFWRGAWGLMDKFFFPDHDTLSYTLSTLIGIGVLYYTHHLTKELT